MRVGDIFAMICIVAAVVLVAAAVVECSVENPPAWRMEKR